LLRTSFVFVRALAGGLSGIFRAKHCHFPENSPETARKTTVQIRTEYEPSPILEQICSWNYNLELCKEIPSMQKQFFLHKKSFWSDQFIVRNYKLDLYGKIPLLCLIFPLQISRRITTHLKSPTPQICSWNYKLDLYKENPSIQNQFFLHKKIPLIKPICSWNYKLELCKEIPSMQNQFFLH
jgi:hypothetical protein